MRILSGTRAYWSHWQLQLIPISRHLLLARWARTKTFHTWHWFKQLIIQLLRFLHELPSVSDPSKHLILTLPQHYPDEVEPQTTNSCPYRPAQSNQTLSLMARHSSWYRNSDIYIWKQHCHCESCGPVNHDHAWPFSCTQVWNLKQIHRDDLVELDPCKHHQQTFERCGNHDTRVPDDFWCDQVVKFELQHDDDRLDQSSRAAKNDSWWWETRPDATEGMKRQCGRFAQKSWWLDESKFLATLTSEWTREKEIENDWEDNSEIALSEVTGLCGCRDESCRCDVYDVESRSFSWLWDDTFLNNGWVSLDTKITEFDVDQKFDCGWTTAFKFINVHHGVFLPFARCIFLQECVARELVVFESDFPTSFCRCLVTRGCVASR